MIDDKHGFRLGGEGESGFTLLELLISMTLLGLIMVVLFGGLRFGARAWEREQANSTGTDEVRLAQTLMRRELSLAYPYFISSDLVRPRIDFDGRADGLEFMAPAPDTINSGGRAKIAIKREMTESGVRLVLSERLELSSADAPELTPEVLVAGLESAAFSYFGAERPTDPPQWLDHWTDQTRLPQLIRVRADFPGHDVRPWPELIVTPKISADVSCIYDVLIKSCRGR